MADPTPSPRYLAFISYSHRDAAFAAWLHRRLEAYRLPRAVAAQRGGDETDSRRLGTFFRDRDELTAAADLTDAVRAAIAQARHLIVVCSPAAARSEWVAREIALFRDLHGDGRILAALHAGTPATAFPPALRSAAGRTIEPLAADFQRGGDGRRLGLLKLVAALGGVGLGALVQRDAQRRVRQVVAIAAAGAIVLAVTAVLALLAVQARRTADRQCERGRATMTAMNGMKAKLRKVGRLDLLAAANTVELGYYDKDILACSGVADPLAYAASLQDSGNVLARQGRVHDASTQFEAAARVTGTLLAEHPHMPDVVFGHAQTEFWLAWLAWRTGRFADAERGFRAYATSAGKLVALDAGNPDYRLEIGYAESNLGMLALRHSANFAEARRRFTAAQAALDGAGRRRPGDVDLQTSIADGYAWLADVERLSGDLERALAFRRTQRAILATLRQKEPGNAVVRAYLLGNTLALARISAARGRFTDALTLLRDGRVEAARLAEADPDDVDLARQVRMFDLFTVRTWLALPRADRPSPATLARTLGRCGEDGARRADAEAAAFCTILTARLAAVLGDRRGADLLAKPMLEKIRRSGERVTEGWRINLTEELSLIRSSTVSNPRQGDSG